MAETAQTTATEPASVMTGTRALLVAAASGAAVAVALGVYGREHSPAGQARSPPVSAAPST
jgi:hypothetical protein